MTRRGTRGNEPGPCSFCKKRSGQVRRLIAGPGVYICDECVAVCVDILEDDAAPESSPGQFVAAALKAALAQRGVADRGGAVAQGGTAASHCGLCRMPVILEESVIVEARGLLCRACVSAVLAGAAQLLSTKDRDNE